VPEAVPGVGDEHVDGATIDREHQFVDAKRRGKVCFDGVGVGARSAELRGRALEVALFSDDHEIVAVLRGEPGEFATKAAGGAGDHASGRGGWVDAM
jgi:hypothetical protein